MRSLLAGLERSKVVPLAEVSSVDQALRVADLLTQHGHTLMEIPLRHPGAIGAIEAVSRTGLITVGAGTIVSSTQLEQAVAAGALFGISPSLSEELCEAAHGIGLPYMPGISTPSEAHRALALGVEVMKVFPAHTTGGPLFIDALSSVFPDARFMPSGGISESNYLRYLKNPNVMAVSGSWLTPRSAIVTENWDEISALLSEHSAGTDF